VKTARTAIESRGCTIVANVGNSSTDFDRRSPAAHVQDPGPRRPVSPDATVDPVDVVVNIEASRATEQSPIGDDREADGVGSGDLGDPHADGKVVGEAGLVDRVPIPPNGLGFG
jgi:hypothetical protein